MNSLQPKETGCQFECSIKKCEKPERQTPGSIKMKMTGTYHEFGNFVSGVAALPRIVTLHDISIKKEGKSDRLTMEVTAKTYRYLDETEIAAHKKKSKGKKRR